MGLEMKQQHSELSVNTVNWHGCQQKHRRTVADHLSMCNGFPTKMIEQTIVTSQCDIMRTSRT